MIKSVFFILLFSFPLAAFSQGTNNDFDFDQEDLQVLFSKMGYEVFKFPISQTKDEIFDIVVEEYRDGKLSKRQTSIELANEAFKEFGIDASNYAKPKMDSAQHDSIYFHRLYIHKTDSILTVNIKTHGLNTPLKFNIDDLYLGDVRAKFEIKEEVDENGFLEVNNNKILAFFYANHEANTPLWCPAGLSKEKLITQFYYVALFLSRLIENQTNKLIKNSQLKSMSKPITQAETLDKSFYTKVENYELSKELLFSKSWLFLSDAVNLKRSPVTIFPVKLLEICLDESLLLGG